MRTGSFKLVIKPKRITATLKMDHEATTEHKSEVLLHYEPTRETLHRRRLKILSECFDEASFLVTSPPHVIPSVSETWNNEQIDDFVRKLGFLEAPNADVEQQVKLFQQLNQVINFVLPKGTF